MASDTNCPAWNGNQEGSRIVNTRSTTPAATGWREDRVAVKGPAFGVDDGADIACDVTEPAPC